MLFISICDIVTGYFENESWIICSLSQYILNGFFFIRGFLFVHECSSCPRELLHDSKSEISFTAPMVFLRFINSPRKLLYCYSTLILFWEIQLVQPHHIRGIHEFFNHWAPFMWGAANLICFCLLNISPKRIIWHK